MDKNALRKSIKENAKILIVDNAKTSCTLLTGHCKSIGFVHIEEAYDGTEALDKSITWKPDLVFLGMYLPKMTGLQICQELQSKNLTSDMAIIMLTSMNTTEFKEEAFDAGIVDFITKPLNIKELTARMMTHLDRLFIHRQLEFNYVRLQAELKEAAMLQRILLPEEPFLDELRTSMGLDIAYSYQPSQDLGGDYFSVRRLSDDTALLVFVDVFGHGTTAALYAFSIHTLLMEHLTDELNPGVLLGILNEKLHDLMPKGCCATLFLGLLDVEQKRLDYAAAASHEAIVLSKDNATILNSTGILLGEQKKVTYDTHTVRFEKGDKLFLYSDALIATANPKGQCIEEEELVDLFIANRSKKSHLVNQAILTHLFSNYSQTLSDDLSLLVVST